MKSQIAMHLVMSTENSLEMVSSNNTIPVVNQVLSTDFCEQTNN